MARSARPNATLKIPKEPDMPDIDDVLSDAQREIKSIGDNVKSLKDNMEKNLADVRKLAEDAPKAFATSEQFKKDMEALTAGVLEKHDAIATKVKELTDGALKAATERMDDFEKKLNRGKLGSGWGDTDEGTKAARAFARDAKALRHELRADFDPDKTKQPNDINTKSDYWGPNGTFNRLRFLCW
jgi:phage shock protein A